jgi:hypothetical protein
MRIAPEEVYKKVKSGAALLVCAYEDEARFRTMQLEQAISLSEFESRLLSFPKD